MKRGDIKMNTKQEKLEKLAHLLMQLQDEEKHLEQLRDKALILLDQKRAERKKQQAELVSYTIQSVGKLISENEGLTSDQILSEADKLLDVLGLEKHVFISPATPMYNTTDLILRVPEDMSDDTFKKVTTLISNIKDDLPKDEKNNSYFLVRSPVEHHDDYISVEFNPKHQAWILRAEKDGDFINQKKSLYTLLSEDLKEHLENITAPDMLP